ncbi:MAG: hypothetical protein ACE15D_13980 [Candidatus Eisenbacteria bacterium]
MTKRILLAGLAGGIVLFVWSSFSHMALPIGEMGLSTLGHEQPVLDALRANVDADGLYFYPQMPPGMAGRKAQEQWAQKIRSGPSGLLLIHVAGSEPMTPWQIVIELLTNLIACILVAALLWWLHIRPLSAGFVGALLGFLGWLNISASYWNWYGFPAAFVIGEGIDQIIGWFLAGLVISAVLWTGARRFARRATVAA